MTDDNETGDRPVLAGRKRPRQRRPTLKTIADLTGLGVSTVSQSLRGLASLKPETRQLIADTARAIGYVPDRAGVRLRTGKTNVIALVLSNQPRFGTYTQQLIAGVGDGVAGTSYHVNVVPDAHADSAETVRRILAADAVDGLIVTHTTPRDVRVRLLLDAGLPFVTHGRTEFQNEHPFHDFHAEIFAERAVERLAALGCRKLMLAHSATNTMNYRTIVAAFSAACADAGVTCEIAADDLVSLGGYEQVRAFGTALARRADHPDGVVCNAEQYALALASGFRAAGIEIGGAIKLVCKETSGIVPIVFPDCDGLFEDVHAAGRELVRLLLRRIDGDRPLDALQTLAEPTPRWRCPPTP